MKKVIVFEDDANDIEMLEHMLIVRLGIKEEDIGKYVIILRDWTEFEEKEEVLKRVLLMEVETVYLDHNMHDPRYVDGEKVYNLLREMGFTKPIIGTSDSKGSQKYLKETIDKMDLANVVCDEVKELNPERFPNEASKEVNKEVAA